MDIVKGYDIILLQETWLHKDTGLNFDIHGYKSEHLFGNKSRTTTKNVNVMMVIYMLLGRLLRRRCTLCAVGR